MMPTISVLDLALTLWFAWVGAVIAAAIIYIKRRPMRKLTKEQMQMRRNETKQTNAQPPPPPNQPMNWAGPDSMLNGKEPI